MSKTLQDFTIKRRGRTGETIDYDKIFDGKVHELKEKSDFEMKIATFRQKVGREARERGGSVETRVDADAGLIQVRFDKNGAKK